MINHLKLPRQASAPVTSIKTTEPGASVEDANRHVLRIGRSVDARSPTSTPSPTPPVWDASGGAKPKSSSRSPQPRRMHEDEEHRGESLEGKKSSHSQSRSQRIDGRDGDPHIRHHQDHDNHSKRFPSSSSSSTHDRYQRKPESHLPAPDAKEERSSKHRGKSSSAATSKALYHLPADTHADPNYRHPSPFPERPGKSKSRQRSEYGIKLGLYAPQKEHKSDVHSGLGEGKREEEGIQDVTRITRYHINACMARESEAYNGGGFPR